MKKNKIDIHITHGKLESFSVGMEDKQINISANIGLYTDNKQKITSFSVDSRQYYGNQKIEFPLSIYPAIQKIAEEIELSTIRKCRENQLSLPSPII